jgi:hypothetical protein
MPLLAVDHAAGSVVLEFLKGGISGSLFKEALCRAAFRAVGSRLSTILVFAMRQDDATTARHDNGNGAARRQGEEEQSERQDWLPRA